MNEETAIVGYVDSANKFGIKLLKVNNDGTLTENALDLSANPYAFTTLNSTNTFYYVADIKVIRRSPGKVMLAFAVCNSASQTYMMIIMSVNTTNNSLEIFKTFNCQDVIKMMTNQNGVVTTEERTAFRASNNLLISDFRYIIEMSDDVSLNDLKVQSPMYYMSLSGILTTERLNQIFKNTEVFWTSSQEA